MLTNNIVIRFQPGLVPVLKHGKHDQKTHAGKGGAMSDDDITNTAVERSKIGKVVSASTLGEDGYGYISESSGNKFDEQHANPTGLARLVKEQGWDKPSQAVDQATFDRLAERDDLVVAWRGGPNGLEKGMIEGTPFIGNGVVGPGTYMSVNRSRAEAFVPPEGGSLVPMLVPRRMVEEAPSAMSSYVYDPITDYGLKGSGMVTNMNYRGDFIVYNTGAIIVGPPIVSGPVSKSLNPEGDVYYKLIDGEAILLDVNDFNEIVLKHGSHDQSTHGRRARSLRGYEERTASGRGQRTQNSGESATQQAQRESEENVDYIMGRTTRAPSWTGPSDPLFVPRRTLGDRVQSARRKIRAWKKNRDRKSMERMTPAQLDKLISKNRERLNRKREEIGLVPVVYKAFDPVYDILQQIFADVVEPSIWVALIEDPRPLVDLTGPLGDLVDDMLDAVAPQGTVIKFAPGLRPVLKHLSGKHDQSTHGRGGGQLELDGVGGPAASDEFSEWGDRAPELIAAKGMGPDADDLRSAVVIDTDSVSDEEVRERVEDDHQWSINDEVEDRMSRTSFDDEEEANEFRAEFREEVLDYYVNAYGDEARESIASENNPTFDTYSMDEVYSVYHEGVNRDGNTVSLESRVIDVEVYGSEVSVRGTISDPDSGNYAGEFHRVFSSRNGEVTVTHELLQLEDEYQGTGFAKVLNRQAENYYITHGIETVNVHAALDGGGYAWASSGFDWDYRRHADSIQNISGNLDYYVRQNPNIPTRLRTDIDSTRMRLNTLSVTSPDYPTPKEIADIGRIDGVSTWPGKEIMRGSNWYGTKTLRPEGARVSETQAARETSRASQRSYQEQRARAAAERAPTPGQLTMDNAFLEGSLAQAPNFQPGLFPPIPGMVQ